MFSSLPWNKHSVIGWMAAIAYITIASILYLIVNSMILLLFIGIFLFFCAFYKHFVILVNEINSPTIEIENFADSPALIQHQKEIHSKEVLRATIQFHVIVKE